MKSSEINSNNKIKHIFIALLAVYKLDEASGKDPDYPEDI